MHMNLSIIDCTNNLNVDAVLHSVYWSLYSRDRLDWSLSLTIPYLRYTQTNLGSLFKLYSKINIIYYTSCRLELLVSFFGLADTLAFAVADLERSPLFGLRRGLPLARGVTSGSKEGVEERFDFL